MVGRDAELAALAAFLETLPRGPGALVIEGEAGVGKTTLWQSGLDQAEASDIRVLVTRGAGSEVRLGYAGLADLLATVPDEIVEELPAPQRRALAAAALKAPHEEGVALDLRAVGTGLAAVLRRLSLDGPILLAIDDLQWLDASSAYALSFALRRSDGALGVLATVRSGSPDAGHVELRPPRPERAARLTLGPLGEAEIRRLLEERTGRSLPRSSLRRITAAAAGNPFMAVEISRDLDAEEYGPATPLPTSLREMVDARLEGLDAPARETLLYAATSTHPRVPLIRQALAGRQVGPALAAAERAGILSLDGARISFSHPLLAAGAYAAASPQDRRAAHRRIAALTDGEERARHLALAAVAPDAEVIEALDSAASATRAGGASANAAELLELALRLGALDPERRIRAAEHHLDAGEIPRARALSEGLVAELPAGSLRARALGALGTIHRLADDMGASLELLERAGEETEEPDRRIRLLLEVAFASTQSGLVGQALPCAASAVEEATRLGDEGLLAQALAVDAMVRFIAGNGLDQEAIDRAVGLEDPRPRTPGVLRPTFIAGLLMSWTGRLEDAHSAIAQIHDEYRDRGEESDLVHMTMHQGTLACLRGDLEYGRRLVADSLERAAQLGSPTSRAVALENQVVVAGWAGEVGVARAAAGEAIAIYQQVGSPVGEFFAGASLGRVELSLGNHAEAAANLLPSTRMAVAIGAGEPDTLQAVPDAIEALVALARLEEAEELRAWQRERSDAIGRPTQLAIAARCDGLLSAAQGSLEEAESSLETALGHHERLPVAFEIARTKLALGNVLRRRRRRAAARRAFDDAVGIFAALGAAVWAERAREARDRTDATRADGGDLTPAELRMAGLAADGLTNRVIAAEVFVSPKTVEATLSRVYRKLGIHSRAELGRRMAERESVPVRAEEAR